MDQGTGGEIGMNRVTVGQEVKEIQIEEVEAIGGGGGVRKVISHEDLGMRRGGKRAMIRRDLASGTDTEDKIKKRKESQQELLVDIKAIRKGCRLTLALRPNLLRKIGTRR